jgi:hypothetical protein
MVDDIRSLDDKNDDHEPFEVLDDDIFQAFYAIGKIYNYFNCG